MGQWDPELRASAEARQAGKQKARQSSDWQRQGTNEAARRTPNMVLEKREKSRRSRWKSGAAR